MELSQKLEGRETNTFSLWAKELRAPFFTAVILPVSLGAVVAWFSLRVFDLLYFVLSLIGMICINAGTNMANDYFDYKSGCDLDKKDFNSPFSGGSGLLPAGLLDPKKVYMASMIFFGFAGLIGAYLTLTRGWIIAVFGLIGVISGYFYTTKLAPRGIGETIVGFNCGPLAVAGSYYVQTQTIALQAVVASISLGILVLAILWVNEIPDYNADAKAGKRTLVTRIGRKKAADAFIILMFSNYVVVLLGVSLSLMPLLALISFLTIPIAARAIRVARGNYNDPRGLVPANAATVLIHLLTGLLLCVAYIISGYMNWI